MLISDSIIAAARAHATESAPRESCGVVVAERGVHRYRPLRNRAGTSDCFVADPSDVAAAEDVGPIVAVVHSHPGAPSRPSEADVAMAALWGVPWLILGEGETSIHRPATCPPPLLGRRFAHGDTDCFALIRDYYREQLGIYMPDFSRVDGWWDRGESLYLEHFAEAGFVDVTGLPLRAHDVPLMQLRAPVPNHAGIYLGDGRLLHHAPGRLSRRDSYSGLWATVTRRVVRHRSLC